ncbi:hypothetical protein PN36_34430 [Candidatus Thiomargarita nelsonii]|uniref:Uncharacterized protein n=1 Tax=Candidatus Thiomargarita nelsonii TaxID=1003181 RepID=A0A0A6S3G1_9GAMM|nr:hypothetical protein PN36_34430 [Candidatus Thiomargarita nelsonii]
MFREWSEADFPKLAKPEISLFREWSEADFPKQLISLFLVPTRGKGMPARTLRVLLQQTLENFPL